SLTTPASDTTCGPTATVTVAKKHKAVIRVKATSSGKPKKDPDTFMLVCSGTGTGCPHPTTTPTCQAPTSCANPCAKNTSGGPDQIDLVSAATGSDLDNGWTGISHNFPTPPR